MKKRFMSNPAPGESLVSGYLVMETTGPGNGDISIKIDNKNNVILII